MTYPYTNDALGLFEPDPPTASCSACGDEVEAAIAYVLGGICEACEQKAARLQPEDGRLTTAADRCVLDGLRRTPRTN